ncbi:hypothetical protein NDI56_20005 [Haloarcula sp. S1CR25-12]|uniref:Uncharacterized protein n=1 Tax=Haloarcula saliterrae TaxID=2950534 RepID=A0ABU2FHG7_9EURY|nr:hypothetical protein [Haloarcula sp. S1CR25-12]MDS0261692.1 hypothetical protein [Haloarcula sp. S1CR25-12]
MSADSDEAGDSLLPEPLRSVTPSSRTRPNESMDAIGWGMLLGLLVLLFPLLPFILIVWLISKATEALTPS